MDFPKILISGSYNAFEEGYSGQGIYFCSGIQPSESFSLNGYIGSTDNLYRRIKISHISSLNAGTHINIVFQNNWNKYGQENFVWFVLEETTPEIQFNVEQKYLDEWRPFADEGRGFNIAKKANQPPSHKGVKRSQEFKDKVSKAQSGENGYWYGAKGDKNPFFGKRHSEEAKRKQRESRNNKPITKETCLKISAALKGKKKSPEHIKNAREARIKSGYKFTSESIEKRRLKIIGKKRSEETNKKTSETLSKRFKIKDKNGEIIEISGKGRFCKENGLSVTNLNKLLNKERDFYKGWTRVD